MRYEIRDTRDAKREMRNARLISRLKTAVLPLMTMASVVACEKPTPPEPPKPVDPVIKKNRN